MKRVAMTLVGASLSGLALADGGLDQRAIASQGLEGLKTVLSKNSENIIQIVVLLLLFMAAYNAVMAVVWNRRARAQDYDDDDYDD